MINTTVLLIKSFSWLKQLFYLNNCGDELSFTHWVLDGFPFAVRIIFFPFLCPSFIASPPFYCFTVRFPSFCIATFSWTFLSTKPICLLACSCCNAGSRFSVTLFLLLFRITEWSVCYQSIAVILCGHCPVQHCTDDVCVVSTREVEMASWLPDWRSKYSSSLTSHNSFSLQTTCFT